MVVVPRDGAENIVGQFKLRPNATTWANKRTRAVSNDSFKYQSAQACSAEQRSEGRGAEVLAKCFPSTHACVERAPVYSHQSRG
jgi:hypothetical protein